LRPGDDRQDAEDANFDRWPSKNSPRAGGWPAEIAHMKSWLATRANWIDGQYLSAPQFSPPGGPSSGGVVVTISAPGGGRLFLRLRVTIP